MALPIVFIHGIRVSGTMWDPVRSHLTGPSAAPDLPGHGSRRGMPYDMDAACAVVAECIRGLGGRALVVGFSLGGYVAIATAARHPGLVAGLVAMGCTARPTGRRATNYRLAGRLAARAPSLAGRLSVYGFRRTLPGPTAEAFSAGGLACEVIPSVVESVTAEDPVASLAAYPGRVWLVNGSRDPFRADELEFLRACAHGSLTWLPARNHLSVLADPAAIADLVEGAARAAASVSPVTSFAQTPSVHQNAVFLPKYGQK
ncbi:alpha/beta fold hydrolase [Planotetraspora kaengkrachanensis]|uniref:Lysophospholipase n=1 Tax=Planotetraspora kaengkrachanensis TaxID=575193 RepID=A0A8J3PPP4_9ACTN|nr:alpha/beta hydrolase [Planotetraspora kaengkrachanensis]GIG77881.1 lysophospholipase [Planotetraspora kaengkrachanensis]